MKPEEMTPQELNAAACGAVGIDSHSIVYLARRKSTGHLEKFYQAEWLHDVERDLFKAPRKVVNFPPVSSDLAACATLMAAAIKPRARRRCCSRALRGARLELVGDGAGWTCELWAPLTREPQGSGWFPPGEVTTAPDMPRAVALAVVSWAQAIEEEGL